MGEAATVASEAGREARPAGPTGPIFIAGRQHSGNTVMAVCFGRVPDCFAQIDESTFFEVAGLLDRKAHASQRTGEILRDLKLARPELERAAKERLEEYAGAHPGARALEQYMDVMDHLTRLEGRRFWIQKATSYIFYGREVLESIPGSKLIYMLRNPYDIAASKKRRPRSSKSVWGTIAGWNKGVRLADEYTRRYPDRFRVVRYEDMVTRPEETIRGLMDWAGLGFDPSYLDVPHVNKSESGYSLTGDGKGLSRSRVYYYVDVLTPPEIAAIDYFVDSRRVRAWYPELPHARERRSLGAALGGLRVAALSPLIYVRDYIRRTGGSPKHMVARSIQRLK